MVVRCLAILATLGCCAAAMQNADRWTTAQDEHFKIYSQTGADTARQALTRFEQLRAFFQQNGLLGSSFSDQGRRALEVISFRSEKEYEEYRLHPLAVAYYLSDGGRDYIIMGALDWKEFGIAAHEYAHYVLHANGVKLPGWLNEGLAEFFSTLRLNNDAFELGGDLPARTQTLRRNKWLPLAELFNATMGDPSMPNAKKRSDIFYAESWALADMLMTSPQYKGHFRELVSELNADSDAAQAFSRVYGVSLDDLEKSLEEWVGHTGLTSVARENPAEQTAVHSWTLSALEAAILLARASLVSGHLDQARMRFEGLSQERPENPDYPAALGEIALRQGNRDEALRQWQRALRAKSTDAALYYRYALLAEEAGLERQQVKASLEQAVRLTPEFDDARYKLALLENQFGEYKSTVEQLRAMHIPAGDRRYAYWLLMSAALIELDQRDEAKQAAHEALKAAQSEADQMKARHMAIIAATDLTVQFATDSAGHSQMVTTRIPHGTTEWNPFIEPSDRIQHANGKLGEVLCAGGKLTGFVLRTSDGPLTVDVPDPTHVLMRNSPEEFFCGPIQEKGAEAVYAVVKADGKTTNVLRGLTFQ